MLSAFRVGGVGVGVIVLGDWIRELSLLCALLI